MKTTKIKTPKEGYIEKWNKEFDSFDKKNNYISWERRKFEREMFIKYYNLFENWEQIKNVFKQNESLEGLRKYLMASKITLPTIVWGIDFNNGWYNLFAFLCKKLDYLLKNNIVESINIVQVKEKFWEMRVYLNYKGTPIEYSPFDLSHWVEDRSKTICEVCWKKGILRSWIWWKTVCSKHNK